MKRKVLVSILATLCALAAMAGPTLAGKPTEPGANPLDTVWAAIQNLQDYVANLSSRVGILETDPVDWTEILNRPSGLDDGDDEPTDAEIGAMGYVKNVTESDPTVATSVKDGVAWNEISDMPAGFADGIDDKGVGDNVKHLVNNFVVASGHNVTAGDIVAFLDGAIQKASFVGDEIALGSGYAYNPASTRGMSVVALSETQFVVVYKDWQDTTSDTAIVGEIHGETITYGPEAVFCPCGDSFDNYAPKMAALSPTKFVVAYNDVCNSDYGTTRIGTVSGTAITFGSTYVFNGAETSSSLLSVSSLSEDGFVVAYLDSANSNYGTAIIGAVSGSDITFGSEYVYNLAASHYNSVVSLCETKFVVLYEDGGSSASGTAVVGQVAGGTITFGAEYQFNAGQTDDISASALSESQFVVAYNDHGNLNYGTAIVGTVSGNTITFDAEEVFNAATAWYMSVEMMAADRFAVVYLDAGNSDYGMAIIGDVSGNSISFGSEYCFNAADTWFVSAATLSDRQFVVVYVDVGSSTFQGIAKIGDTSTQGKVIGIAKTTAGEGESVPVIIIGVSDVHSDLIIGETYFAATDGSLTTTVTDCRIGFAVSESELLLSIAPP